MRIAFVRFTCLLIIATWLYVGSGCGDSDKGPKANSNKPAAKKPSPPTDEAPKTQTDTAVAKSDTPSTDSSKTTTPRPNPASNEPWGDLKLRFVYDGTPPERKQKTVDKDKAVCGKVAIFDESLIVNKENQGVENVVMWLYPPRGKKLPTPHPSYKDSASEPAVLNNKDCHFEPHVCIMQVGQAFHIKNSDPVGHNTKYDLFANNLGVNYQIAAGDTKKLGGFEKAESVPQPANCNAHGWMSAQLLIVDTPYVAKSDNDGNLIIKNLPVGEWTFRIHQEVMGYGQNLKVGSETSDRRGTIKLKINGGENDMGVVKLDPALFKN